MQTAQAVILNIGEMFSTGREALQTLVAIDGGRSALLLLGGIICALFVEHVLVETSAMAARRWFGAALCAVRPAVFVGIILATVRTIAPNGQATVVNLGAAVLIVVLTLSGAIAVMSLFLTSVFRLLCPPPPQPRICRPENTDRAHGPWLPQQTIRRPGIAKHRCITGPHLACSDPIDDPSAVDESQPTVIVGPQKAKVRMWVSKDGPPIRAQATLRNGTVTIERPLPFLKLHSPVALRFDGQDSVEGAVLQSVRLVLDQGSVPKLQLTVSLLNKQKEPSGPGRRFFVFEPLAA